MTLLRLTLAALKANLDASRASLLAELPDSDPGRVSVARACDEAAPALGVAETAVAARPAPPASTGALVAVRWPHSRLCACGCRRG